MKVISVIKRVGAIAAVGASMYLSPAYAQYTLDPVVITASNTCWYWGSCSYAPEIPGYIWTSWGGVGYYTPIGGGSGGSGGGPNLGANLAQSLQLRDKANKQFDDNCYRSGESVADWMSRVIAITVPKRDTALTMAVTHVSNSNQGASSFVNLQGYSDDFMRPQDARTLNPKPC